jgi:hypothetical protein
MFWPEHHPLTIFCSNFGFISVFEKPFCVYIKPFTMTAFLLLNSAHAGRRHRWAGYGCRDPITFPELEYVTQW